MKQFVRGVAVAAMAVLWVVLPQSSAGAVAAHRYVATTGSDSGTCTSSAAPCATVNYAVGQASAGDTINVAAGTYPEMVTVDKELTFSGANAGIEAGAYPGTRGAESTVKGFRSPANTPGWPYPDVDQEYSTIIDGFRIDPQGDASLLSASTHHLVALFGGPNVQVTNNVFDGGPYDPACGYTCTTMTDSALNIQSGAFTVRGNLFTNFRAPVDISQHDETHPITDGLIQANAFTHITSRAVWLYDDSAPGNFPGVTVDHNDFDATGWNNPDWGPAAVVITTAGNDLIGNTIRGFSSGVFDQVCDGSNPGTKPNTYADNQFLGNGTGVQYFVAAAPPCDPVAAAITGNQFVGNTKFGVRWNGVDGFVAPSVLDATCNYWGASTGANTTGADKTTDAVDADPWQGTGGGACDSGVPPTTTSTTTSTTASTSTTLPIDSPPPATPVSGAITYTG